MEAVGGKNRRREEKAVKTKEMVHVALYELLHYPKRSAGWRVKRIVRLLTGRVTEPLDKINWPTGLLANALIAFYKNNLNSEESLLIMRALKKYFDRWINHRQKLYYIDDILCGMALIEYQQLTGEARYQEALTNMVQYLYNHETDKEGSLPYRPAQQNGHIYADGIGMICPFLCKYGMTYNDSNALNLAIKQINNFTAHGMDDRSGLPYHGYEYNSGTKYGIIGWGRAVGWLMMGMADSLVYMDKDSEAYVGVKQAFRRLVDKVEAYQLENGLYAWQLSAREGPVDTSATAMILYAISRGLEHDILIGIHRSRLLRGKEALREMVKDGRLADCLAECGGFGIYPQHYGAYPWSLGPALALFATGRD